MSCEDLHQFRVGANRLEDSGMHHVTHLPSAIDILQRQSITANEIRANENALSATTARVVYFTPYPWHQSPYGTLRFTFDWNALFADRHIYCLGTCKNYGETISQLFASSIRRDELEPYDAVEGNGPWQKQNNINFHDSRSRVEFLLDGNIPLEHCKEIVAVNHYDRWCVRNKSNSCVEMQYRDTVMLERLFMACVAKKIEGAKRFITVPDEQGHLRLREPFYEMWCGFIASGNLNMARKLLFRSYDENNGESICEALSHGWYKMHKTPPALERQKERRIVELVAHEAEMWLGLHEKLQVESEE